MASLKVVWAVFAYCAVITIYGCGGGKGADCTKESGNPDACTKGDCCAGCGKDGEGNVLEAGACYFPDGGNECRLMDESTHCQLGPSSPCTKADGADACTKGDCCEGCDRAAGDDEWVDVKGADKCFWNGNECRYTEFSGHCEGGGGPPAEEGPGPNTPCTKVDGADNCTKGDCCQGCTQMCTEGSSGCEWSAANGAEDCFAGENECRRLDNAGHCEERYGN